MRICLIGNAKAVHLQRWATAYVAAGHEVHIVSIRSHAVESATMHTRHVGPLNSGSAVWTSLSYLWLAAVVRRLVRRIDPDVVHAQYVTTSGVMARLTGNEHVVLTAWGSDVIPRSGTTHNVIIRSLNRWALEGAQRVTSASSFMLDRITSTYGISDVALVPFGVDTDLFAPHDTLHDGPLRLGIVKSLNRKYGIEYAISSLAIVKESLPDASLTVVGTGPLLSDLQEHARTSGVEDSVHFVGLVPHDDVPAMLREFDIFLNTSVVAESFGVAILEAGACGIAVVATDVGGVSETCLPGTSALLVQPGDARALADAVSTLDDADLRRKFGQAGRAFVEHRFTWDHSVETMMRILEDVKRP
ncbi:MAG: glycosyltransferase [Acidimicrobiia bacterium]|nr:MAG: glycosyltransferase [Acidimicrobiia bacterium]